LATGISISNTSNLSNGQKILVANAMRSFEPSAPNPDLVMSVRIPQGHKQWDISTYARLSTASALTEGVDLSQYQQLLTSTLQITPSEHGVIALISKRLVRRQGDANVMAETGMLVANSLRRRMDLDIIALFSGFSKSVVGSTNTLDITHFRGSVAYLLTDNDSNAEFGPAPLPLHASLHIEQISDIILDISDTSGATSRPAGFSDDLLQRWWKGRDRLYGVSIFHGGNIERDSTGDSKGAIFAREALALVIAEVSEAVEERDISLRATEVGIFQEWGEGERADTHGVTIYSNTAATV
jgi:hypothetical protein